MEWVQGLVRGKGMEARQGTARPGMAWSGEAGQARLGEARHCGAWRGRAGRARTMTRRIDMASKAAAKKLAAAPVQEQESVGFVGVEISVLEREGQEGHARQADEEGQAGEGGEGPRGGLPRVTVRM